MMNQWSSFLLSASIFLNVSMVIYVLIFFSVVLIIFIISRNIRHSSKIDQMIREKEMLIRKLEVKEEAIKSLMADNSMRLTFKEEWLSKLKNEVHVAADASELRQSLNSLIAQLRLQIDTEYKLAGLQEKIDHNDINFDSKLKELYPDLTKGEREVCALLRLNLSIKEIMIIRNVSSDSVKSMRRRIRKKMNIPSEIELENFIQELT